MYDEDQQNHLRNLKNGAELFNDLAMSVKDHKTTSVLGDNSIKKVGMPVSEFTVKEEDENNFNFRQSSVYVPSLAQQFRKSAFQK